LQLSTLKDIAKWMWLLDHNVPVQLQRVLLVARDECPSCLNQVHRRALER